MYIVARPSDSPPPPPILLMQPTLVDEVLRVVAVYYRKEIAELVGPDRHKSVAFARHVAMYLCKTRYPLSFPEIGRAFGNRDHTTVMSAVRKVAAWRAVNIQVDGHLDLLERKLAEAVGGLPSVAWKDSPAA